MTTTFKSTANSVNEESLALLLQPKNHYPQVGPGEQGRFNKNGISHFSHPAGSHRFVLAVDGVIMSGLQVMSMNDKHGVATNAYTAPLHQGQGYGSALMKKAMTHFESLSFSPDLSDAGAKLLNAVHRNDKSLSQDINTTPSHDTVSPENAGSRPRR